MAVNDSAATRYALFLDVGRCVGCEACAVACMDQNDLEAFRKEDTWRRVFKVESGAYPEAHIAHVSLACMHCGDAPCLLACPTGAIGRDSATDAVLVDASRCIGCRSCSIACPFGVPRYGRDGRMEKCDLCAVRVGHGLEPACVRVCPARALQFGPTNMVADQQGQKAADRLAAARRSQTSS